MTNSSSDNRDVGRPAPGEDVRSREGLSAIFRRFYVPLVRYAHRITGDPNSASDVLQDVFLKVWEQHGSLTVRVSLQAMLYTMVRNRALKVNRRRLRTAHPVDFFDIEQHVPDHPDALEDELEGKVLLRYLAHWIDGLPPRRREAFMLSRYHGLSHAEIAEIMGVSARSVDTHILLALRELRSRLDVLQRKGVMT